MPSDLTRKAALKLCILGIDLSCHFKEGLRVLNYQSILQNRIPSLAKEFDAIVLLAYGDEGLVPPLANEFPELAAIFIAGTRQTAAPKTVNGIIIAAVAQKGKFLVRTTLTGHRNNWKLASGEIVELSESFADDPAQIENLNAYKKRLKELKIDPKDSGEVPALLANLPADYRYAGTAACAKCHIQDSAIFSKTQHAHGLETLRAKEFAFDPFCLKCHTTGYGGPGGFVNADATPALGGIGCENCHGPGQAHALHRKSAQKDADHRFEARMSASCHDPENSPKFEYNAYWQKIAHGQEKLK